MAKSPKNKSSNAAISRYGWMSFGMLLVFVGIIYFIFKIKYVEGEEWRKIGLRQTVKQDRILRPNRGNIYADDGRLLATSEPQFGIHIDFMAEGIVKDSLMRNIDALSKALAHKFPDRTAEQYKAVILDGWNLSRKELNERAIARRNGRAQPRSKSRYIRIIRPNINYLELKELRTFPFLNQRNNKSGLIATEQTMRLKPFGRLAGRTIGNIHTNLDSVAVSGIEKKYDTLLRGTNGTKTRQKVGGRWIDVILEEPIDGLDIETTINVDYQDIAEKALYAKLAETGAESGCAVVMEVKTGEVKAITNLDRVSEGVYAEGKPNAFSYMSEPGSTFKAISLLIALEDGVVTPDELLEVGNGQYGYAGRTIYDHDWRKGRDKGYMSVTQGMYSSSNVAIAKMILKGYENNPAKFTKRIHELGIATSQTWDVPLDGIEGTVNIRMADDKTRTWSKTALPWMSFGYETQVPPMYMLMFYNGIANDGRMIKPFITKAFWKGGKKTEEFETEVVNRSLASRKTIKQVQDILRGVVTDGTGRAVNSDIVSIAGKTGTAQIAAGGRYGAGGHFVSFVGYFPADKPKYTCFVGIRRPRGNPIAGTMPGHVFKSIAEGITVREMVSDPILAPVDTIRNLLPSVKNGLYANTEIALKKLKQDFTKSDSKWIRTSTAKDKIEILDTTIGEQVTIPNVVGMGLRDAIYLLENAGLIVSVQGSGRITSQSIAAGSRYQKGSRITISLN